MLDKLDLSILTVYKRHPYINIYHFIFYSAYMTQTFVFLTKYFSLLEGWCMIIQLIFYIHYVLFEALKEVCIIKFINHVTVTFIQIVNWRKVRHSEWRECFVYLFLVNENYLCRILTQSHLTKAIFWSENINLSYFYVCLLSFSFWHVFPNEVCLNDIKKESIKIF